MKRQWNAVDKETDPKTTPVDWISSATTHYKIWNTTQIRRQNKTFNLDGHTKAKPTRRIIILGHNQVNERLQPDKKLQGNIFSSRPQPTKIPTHVRNYSQPQPSE